MNDWKVALAFGVALCGCSSSSGSAGGGGSSSPPSVKISSPASGSAVVLDFANDLTDVDGTVTVKNFKVGAKGTADGQVWILVDGPQCNDHTALGARKPYNTLVPSDEDGGPMDGTSFSAGIDYCDGAPANITGMHTITAELHKDDGSPVLAADGGTVSDSITVVVSLAASAGGADGGGD